MNKLLLSIILLVCVLVTAECGAAAITWTDTLNGSVTPNNDDESWTEVVADSGTITVIDISADTGPVWSPDKHAFQLYGPATSGQASFETEEAFSFNGFTFFFGGRFNATSIDDHYAMYLYDGVDYKVIRIDENTICDYTSNCLTFDSTQYHRYWGYTNSTTDGRLYIDNSSTYISLTVDVGDYGSDLQQIGVKDNNHASPMRWDMDFYCFYSGGANLTPEWDNYPAEPSEPTEIEVIPYLSNESFTMIGRDNVSFYFTTNVSATLKYNETNTDYNNMTVFNSTGGTTHRLDIINMTDSYSHDFYISGGVNDVNYHYRVYIDNLTGYTEIGSITFTESDGVNRVRKPYIVNITNISFTNNKGFSILDSSNIEEPFDVISNGTDWINVLFLVDADANTNTIYTLYQRTPERIKDHCNLTNFTAELSTNIPTTQPAAGYDSKANESISEYNAWEIFNTHGKFAYGNFTGVPVYQEEYGHIAHLRDHGRLDQTNDPYYIFQHNTVNNVVTTLDFDGAVMKRFNGTSNTGGGWGQSVSYYWDTMMIEQNLYDGGGNTGVVWSWVQGDDDGLKYSDGYWINDSGTITFTAAYGAHVKKVTTEEWFSARAGNDETENATFITVWNSTDTDRYKIDVYDCTGDDGFGIAYDASGLLLNETIKVRYLERFGDENYTYARNEWMDINNPLTYVKSSLSTTPGYTVSGTIYGANGLGEGQVTITLGSDSTTTSSGGLYSFTSISPDTYTLTASKPGLQDVSTTIIVSGDTNQDLTMALATSPGGGGQQSSDLGLPFNISGPISRLDGLFTPLQVSPDLGKINLFWYCIMGFGLFMFADGTAFHFDKSRNNPVIKLKYHISAPLSLILIFIGLLYTGMINWNSEFFIRVFDWPAFTSITQPAMLGTVILLLGILAFIDGLTFYLDKSRKSTFLKIKYQVLIAAGLGLGILGAVISNLLIFS